MGVVYHAIEDGIGEGRVADDVVQRSTGIWLVIMVAPRP